MTSPPFAGSAAGPVGSHGLQPGCELLPEPTAAGPGSPVGAGTRRHPAPTGLAPTSWFKPGHNNDFAASARRSGVTRLPREILLA
jgi:hypothetical protein